MKRINSVPIRIYRYTYYETKLEAILISKIKVDKIQISIILLCKNTKMTYVKSNSNFKISVKLYSTKEYNQRNVLVFYETPRIDSP